VQQHHTSRLSRRGVTRRRMKCRYNGRSPLWHICFTFVSRCWRGGSMDCCT